MEAMFRMVGIGKEKREELKAKIDKVRLKLGTREAVAKEIFALVASRALALSRRKKLTRGELGQEARTLRKDIEEIVKSPTGAPAAEPMALVVFPSVVDEAFAEHAMRTGKHPEDESTASADEKVTVSIILDALFCALAAAVGIGTGPGCAAFGL